MHSDPLVRICPHLSQPPSPLAADVLYGRSQNGTAITVIMAMKRVLVYARVGLSIATAAADTTTANASADITDVAGFRLIAILAV